MILTSPYSPPPFWQWNAHFQTIAPNRFRKLPQLDYKRTQIATPDGGFLDLDWSALAPTKEKRPLVILTHGLEGSSNGVYMRGMAHAFNEQGWDALAWNARSCNGDWPKVPRLYYHGEIEDIHTVVQHAEAQGYQHIVLIGFSMGASITLKYLGVKGAATPKSIKASINFSCPANLGDCADSMDLPRNRLYKFNFLRTMKRKVERLGRENPHFQLPLDKLWTTKRWREFDEYFSARLWGFDGAEALYASGSAANFAAGIQVPSLLVNAINDPMLPASCMPFEQADQHPFFHFEQTQQGGHVGFATRTSRERMWSELRALSFLQTLSEAP